MRSAATATAPARTKASCGSNSPKRSRKPEHDLPVRHPGNREPERQTARLKPPSQCTLSVHAGASDQAAHDEDRDHRRDHEGKHCGERSPRQAPEAADSVPAGAAAAHARAEPDQQPSQQQNAASMPICGPAWRIRQELHRDRHPPPSGRTGRPRARRDRIAAPIASHCTIPLMPAIRPIDQKSSVADKPISAPPSIPIHPAGHPWPQIIDGAGDGNRTHVSSLGSCSSTIELHPQRRNCRHVALARQSARARAIRERDQPTSRPGSS